MNLSLWISDNFPKLCNFIMCQEFTNRIKFHLFPNKDSMTQYHPHQHLCYRREKLMFNVLRVAPSTHQRVFILLYQDVLKVQILMSQTLFFTYMLQRWNYFLQVKFHYRLWNSPQLLDIGEKVALSWRI